MSMGSWLGRLLLAALTSAGVEATSDASALKALPEAVLEEVIDDWEDGARDESRGDIELLRLLAADERPRVRARVAQVCSGLGARDGTLLPMLRSLVVDADDGVRASAGEALRANLFALPPIVSMGVVADWALDADEKVRLALASALPGPAGTIGARTALEHLSSDPSPEVRAQAEQARIYLLEA